MDNYDIELVDAISKLSPLARTKIRATLEDFSTEITSGAWASLFGKENPRMVPQPCGCLMMDGYFKEHPFGLDNVEWDGAAGWLIRNDEWIDELIPFYEMQAYGDAGLLIGAAADAYDEWVGGVPGRSATKIVRGVLVLRVPARRRLIKLVDKANTNE